MTEEHICCNCKSRIFRFGYKINNELYCRRCLRNKFGIRFSDSEYKLPVKEVKDNE